MNWLAEMSNPIKRGGGHCVQHPMERKSQKSELAINKIIEGEIRLQFFFIDCFLQLYSPTVCIIPL